MDLTRSESAFFFSSSFEDFLSLSFSVSSSSESILFCNSSKVFNFLSISNIFISFDFNSWLNEFIFSMVNCSKSSRFDKLYFCMKFLKYCFFILLILSFKSVFSEFLYVDSLLFNSFFTNSHSFSSSTNFLLFFNSSSFFSCWSITSFNSSLNLSISCLSCSIILSLSSLVLYMKLYLSKFL